MALHPPLDGSLPVLPGFIDFYATRDPQRPWAVLAPDSGQGPLPISFLAFAQATHRVAHIMNPVEAPASPGTMVAILANCDTIIYLALIVGLSRAGLIPFPISPRNSPEAVVNLLQKTSCHRMIAHGILPPMLHAVHSQLKVSGFELEERDIPSLNEIFPCIHNPESTSELKPYPARPDVGLDDLTLYLHSSGSTGLPKPIPWRQRQLLQLCRSSIIRDARDREVKWSAMALPTFHAMGIIIQLCAPIASGHHIGLYWPKYPAPPVVPTPQNALEGCRATGCTGMPSVPAFVAAWAQSDDHVKFLASLSVLVYAGGPLSEKIGTQLVEAGVPLYSWYGGTEFGAPTRILDAVEPCRDGQKRKTKAEWQWMEFPAENVNVRWVPEGDGSFELQFSTCDIHVPSVENIEDIRGYATSDLWEQHPTKPWLWRITGRKDDVIVLGSGEKVVPVPQEGMVMSHPMVAGAVMFGRGRNECGILVEPNAQYAIDAEDPKATVQFRQKIWPIVEEANSIAPTFARIFKEMIIVAAPAKPLPRAAKGTIVRKQALALYEDAIEKLYKTVADSSGVQGISPPNSWSAESIEPWLVEHAKSINSNKSILPDVDVFEQGFDSLHATFLRNRIMGALRVSEDLRARKAAQCISPNFVFENNTLRVLANTIAALIDPEADLHRLSKEDAIRTMISKYSSDLPKPLTIRPTPARDLVVLLTGTTGNLGSHVLAALLCEPRVQRVYAFNRPHPDTLQRHVTSFGDRGLSIKLLDSPKLVHVSGDLYKPEFGLDPSLYKQIVDDVTHVIHNAWRVDFNHSLSSFESHVAGTRQLVNMCCSSAQSTKLIFTSSISATHKWDVALGPVPEEILENVEVAASNGYAASKFVVENVLNAAYKNGLQCTSLRVGQVCATKERGAWSTSEWVPNLIKSSLSLGVFPDLGGTVSWIPVDALARALLDLVLSTETLPPLMNLVHPQEITWSQLLKTLMQSLKKPDMPVVPLSEWVSMVEAAADKARVDDLRQIPAIKLLDFFRSMVQASEHAMRTGAQQFEAGGLPVYATTKLRSFCPSVRSLEHLDASYAEAWTRYWMTKGFIASE